MHIFDLFDIFSVFGAFSRFFVYKICFFENPASVKEMTNMRYECTVHLQSLRSFFPRTIIITFRMKLG